MCIGRVDPGKSGMQFNLFYKEYSNGKFHINVYNRLAKCKFFFKAVIAQVNCVVQKQLYIKASSVDSEGSKFWAQMKEKVQGRSLL